MVDFRNRAKPKRRRSEGACEPTVGRRLGQRCGGWDLDLFCFFANLKIENGGGFLKSLTHKGGWEALRGGNLENALESP